jgi:hypothetical protein
VRVLQGSPEKLRGLLQQLPEVPLKETIRWMLDD